MNHQPSWRATLAAAVCSSSIVFTLGYLYLWAVAR